MLYNVYCDETCHLEHDNSNVMVLGAVWCPQSKLKEINERIRQIKKRNNVQKLICTKIWLIISLMMMIYIFGVSLFQIRQG